MTSTSNKHYIIDTDAGVDDAIAILMALKYLTPDEFIAITTVFGNVDLAQANHNMDVLLAHVAPAWTSLPVHPGAAKPLVSMVGQRWPGHGPDGFGGLAGSPPSSVVLHRDNAAVLALMQYVKDYPQGSITLIALGPLSNIALAIQLMPDFVERLDHLIFLGGTTSDSGNSTPFAEFNVGCDPEAAQVVFQACAAAPQKLSVVPFDLCLQHGLSWAFYDRLIREEHPNAKFIQKLCTAFERVCRGDSFNAFLPADAYAIAIVLHKRYVIQKQRVHGQIELSFNERRGANRWIERNDETKNPSTTGLEIQFSLPSEPDVDGYPANSTVISAIDQDVFEQLIWGLVQHE